ncbi:hypothetical protein LguiA_008063 [Lonicera macranthoides]
MEDHEKELQYIMALVESWNVTPNDGINLNTLPPDLLIIQFEVHSLITSLRRRQSPDGNSFWEEHITRFAPRTTTSLELPRDVLLSETDLHVLVQQISNVLENLSVPRDTHSPIIEEIYWNAVLLESESWENYMRIRPILVEIGVVPFDVNQDIEELMMMDEDLVILYPSDDDEWSIVDVGEAAPAYKAASRSSIEELEKTSAGPSLEGSSCSVCLEEFEVGSEVACMPCSHYYHTGCIIEWLEKSNMCPLCRFQMPVDPDGE